MRLICQVNMHHLVAMVRVLTRRVDYFKTLVSITIAGVNHVQQLLRVSRPYLLILMTFGAFLYWNNGVVLGTGLSIHPMKFFSRSILLTCKQAIKAITSPLYI